MLLTLFGALTLGALAQQPALDGAWPVDVVRQLSGVWKADEDRTPRTSELDTQVFGPGAFTDRNVTLTIQPSGEATLSVSTAVVGRKGHRYAPSVIEARLRIGAPVGTFLGRPAPAVSVVSAEERYLDGGHERWPLSGPRATITVTTSTTLEFRLDTTDGRTSFGATLNRQRSR